MPTLTTALLTAALALTPITVVPAPASTISAAPASTTQLTPQAWHLHMVTPRAGATNIRSGPSTRNRVIDTLYPGVRASCSPNPDHDAPCISTNGWTKIYGIDGDMWRVGYVATNLVRVVNAHS